MNMIMNILPTQTTGMTAQGENPSTAGASGDLFSLLSTIMSKIGNIENLQSLTGDGTNLPEEISALLNNLPTEQKELLPDVLNLLQPGAALQENISPDAALQKIVSLVKDATGKGPHTQTSLLQDMILTAQSQPEQKITLDDMNDFLTAMAENIDSTDSIIGKILLGLAGQEDILSALKEQIAALTLHNGEINKDILQTLRQDMTRTLKNNGYTTAEIEKQLTLLARQLTTETASVTTQTEDANALLFAKKKTDAAVAQRKPDIQAPLMPQQAETIQNARPQTAQASNLALLNQVNAGQNGFDMNGGGYQQEHKTLFSQENLMTGALKTDSALDSSGFKNYIDPLQQNMPTRTTEMISLQLKKNAQAKIDSMTLQLEPADLGRLQIEMTFDKDGGMKAKLMADKADTLALLQKDSAVLHRALQDAGFDMDDGSLSFDLRQDNPHHDGRELGDAHKNNNSAFGDFEDAMNGAENIPAASQINATLTGYITPGGVNIMV